MIWKILWVMLFVWNSINAATSVNDQEYGWAVLAALAALFSLFMLAVEEVRDRR